MKIIYNNTPKFKIRCMLKRVLTTAIKCLAQPNNIAVEVNFVDKSSIQSLNKKHRNVDNPTDVLSFPMFDITRGKVLDKTYLEAGERHIFLGCISVCVDVVCAQAEEYGHSFQRELAFLVLHGFLHLLGYDHIDEDDEKIMMLVAKRILDKIKITREKNG